MPILDHLEPRAVFSCFEQLCAIPHGSGNTKAISDYLVRFAAEHQLRCIQDAHNNVIIFAPGTPGYESAAPVILQGHMDMVCETAPDCAKDMAREGLDLFVDGDTIGARGTTLGGDDGIAVADAAAAQAAIADMDATLRHEYAAADPDVSVRVDAAQAQQPPMDEASTQRAVCMLCCLPNGIQAMSRDIPGLVQTSLNLGILTTDADTVQASFCVRSSVSTQKEMLVARLRCLMAQLGGTVAVSGDYPAWEYRKDSPLRERMVAVFREQYGRDPKVEAIHAGVECGLFAGKLPGLDCVSFGPDLTEIHTCRERMHIASVQRVWRYTLEVLRRCK